MCGLLEMVLSLSYVEQFSYISDMAERLIMKGEYDAALCIVMGAWVTPFQVRDGVELAFSYVRGTRVIRVGEIDVEGDDRKLYPLKSHPGAMTKVNVFFADARVDAKAYAPHAWELWRRSSGHTQGMSNDQAAGWLMWLAGAVTVLPEDVCLGILAKSQDAQWLGSLSAVCKGVGVGSSGALAVMCELKTLWGRATGVVDFEKERSFRVDEDEFRRVAWSGIDDEELRMHIRAVYAEEIGDVDNSMTAEDAWNERWATTPAGSHARRIEDVLFGARVTDSQSTRRDFIENVEECMIGSTEPYTLYGQSEKLENGKTRALFAGDTVQMLNFAYVLGRIEKAWLGKRVMLSPGSEWAPKLYERLGSKVRWNVMSDYTDFNSQHSRGAMKMLFEELRAYMPGDAVLEWCIESFDNSWVAVGDFVLKWLHTLASGHRATTFINSVLNAVYIRCVVGPAYLRCDWIHAGDDVHCGVQDEATAVLVNVLINVSTLRMNKSKQGFGKHGGEFLRASFDSRGAVGYLARVCASTVSGNWVSESVQGSREYVEAVLERVWTLKMRSGGYDTGLMMVSTVRRRLPALSHRAVDICRCLVAVNDSPVFGDGQSWKNVDVVFKDRVVPVERKLSGYATRDYITNCVDVEVVETVGGALGSLFRPMLEVSYGRERVSDSIESVSVENRLSYGLIDASYRPDLSRRQGALSSIFPLTYMKERLDTRMLTDILSRLGYVVNKNVRELAWGEARTSIAVMTAMPYSCASLVARATAVPVRVFGVFSVFM